VGADLSGWVLIGDLLISLPCPRLLTAGACGGGDFFRALAEVGDWADREEPLDEEDRLEWEDDEELE